MRGEFYELRAFLEELDLGGLLRHFLEQDIDDTIFAELRDADLRELGLSLGQRKKFLIGLDRRRAQPGGNGSRPLEGASLEVRRLSVMFCDMVGSTELASRMSADEVCEVLQAYYRIASKVTRRFGGFISTLQGDGIVVIFGYPQTRGANAERAVASGLALLAAFGARDLCIPGSRSIPFRVRIGIASGRTIVGQNSDEFARSEIQMFGPVPNLAARLQTAAETGALVIDDATRTQVGDSFVCERLPDASLKGFDAPVPISRVIGARHGGRLHAGGSRIVAAIGRKAETEALLRVWSRAKASRSGSAAIVGEPGLGKTLALRMIEARAELEGARVVRLACSPLAANAPLQPVIEALEDMIGSAGESADSARLDALRNHLPEAPEDELLRVAAMLGIQVSRPAPNHPGPAAREALLGILTAWLLGHRDRPTLIALEDAHWADATTLELLERIETLRAGRRLMLVVTSRDPEEKIWSSDPDRLLLRLSALPQPEASEMLDAILGGRAVPFSVRRDILGHSDGNPLLIEELAKSSERWSENLDRDVQAPGSIYDSVAERLDALQIGRPVASGLAAFGMEADVEALRTSLSMSSADLDVALEELREAQILERALSGAEAVVRFRHMLYRDVVYERLPSPTRAALHAAAARAILELDPDRAARQPELLAWHLLRAGDFEAAAPLALQAGERLAQQSALIEAGHYLDEALSAIDEFRDDADASRMRLRALAALAAVNRARFGIGSDGVGELSKQALDLARRLGDRDAELLALNGLYANALVRADYRAAEVWALDLQSAAKAAGNDTFAMIGARAAGVVALHVGDFEGAVAGLRAALEQYDVVRHKELAYAHGYDHAEICAVFLSFALWVRGDLEAARRTSAYAVRHSRIIEHAHSLAQSLSFRALLGMLAHDDADLAEAGVEAVEVSEQHGLKVMAAAGRFFHGSARLLALTRAPTTSEIMELLEAREPFLKHNPFNYRPATEVGIASCAFKAGLLDLAEGHLARGEQAQSATGEIWTAAELMRVRAHLAGARGGPEATKSELIAAFEFARSTGAATFALRIACDLAEVDPSEEAHARLGTAAGAMISFDDGWDTRRLQMLQAGAAAAR